MKPDETELGDNCPECGAVSYQGGYCFRCGTYRPSKHNVRKEELDAASFMECNFGERIWKFYAEAEPTDALAESEELTDPNYRRPSRGKERHRIRPSSPPRPPVTPSSQPTDPKLMFGKNTMFQYSVPPSSPPHPPVTPPSQPTDPKLMFGDTMFQYSVPPPPPPPSLKSNVPKAPRNTYLRTFFALWALITAFMSDRHMSVGAAIIFGAVLSVFLSVFVSFAIDWLVANTRK
jgi:hypothetical protein